MSWLDKLMGKPEPMQMVAEAAPYPVDGLLRDGIHHEYFVDEEQGRFPWLCRVYAKDATPHQMTGNAETRDQARTDALGWAAAKKRELRGAP